MLIMQRERERERELSSYRNIKIHFVPSFLLLADTTGEYSIYTSYANSEMMFHVSTLLPFTPVNKQQVQ